MKKHISISMGVLPKLTKEQGKILLEDLEKSKIKKGTFEGCGKRLKQIIKENGL